MRTLRDLSIAFCLFVISSIVVHAQALPTDYNAGAAHGLKMGKLYGYGFDNWKDPVGSITFRHYAKAFYNVSQDSSDPASWLDYGVYMGIARNLCGGHCFAMSSMSIAMNTIGGFHGFCCPTAQYRASKDVDVVLINNVNQYYEGGPADTALLEAMRIMQSHQLSLSTILTYVDQINSRVARHGFRMLGFFEAALASEGAVLLNVTKSIRPRAEGTMVAHSMIAYKVERTGPQQGKIWVVDPNRCAQYNAGEDSAQHIGWYQSGSNYVQINNGSWLYYGAVDPTQPPSTWPAEAADVNDVSNGFLLCVPMSRVGTAGVSLGSLGLSIGNISSGLRETLGMIFISGSKPHIRQVATPDGRRLYDPVTESLEDSDDKRIDRLVPIPLSMSTSSSQSESQTVEFFAADRSFDSITVHATTGSDGASLVYMGRGAMATVKTATPNSDVDVTFLNMWSAQPSIIVESSNDLLLSIEVVQRLPDNTMARKVLDNISHVSGRSQVTIPMQSAPPVTLPNE